MSEANVVYTENEMLNATTGQHHVARSSSRSRGILFVEDEAFVRLVTCEVLRSAGYSVFTAKNAAEALEIYQRRRGALELLLTDVVLPDENGLELAGRLRRDNPELKVLFVTGYAEQMGADRLAKPFSTEVLLRRLRGLLDRGGSADATEEVVRRVCDIA